MPLRSSDGWVARTKSPFAFDILNPNEMKRPVAELLITAGLEQGADLNIEENFSTYRRIDGLCFSQFCCCEKIADQMQIPLYVD